MKEGHFSHRYAVQVCIQYTCQSIGTSQQTMRQALPLSTGPGGGSVTYDLMYVSQPIPVKEYNYTCTSEPDFYTGMTSNAYMIRRLLVQCTVPAINIPPPTLSVSAVQMGPVSSPYEKLSLDWISKPAMQSSM